jgi:ubiquinone/menaquinone biosynthesis C-methylase UbiE
LDFIVFDVRTHRWVVDNEANEVCWAEMRTDVLKVLKSHSVKVLDLGGGPGSFSSPIHQRDSRNSVTTIDLDLKSLRMAGKGINPVEGNILEMPFRNGIFDGVLGRAILHHIPNDLEPGISEIYRVLKPRGMLVIQEPCNGNILANLARKFFKTEKHEVGEEPLDQKILLKAISKRFEITEVNHHFLFSYLMPHIAARSRLLRRSMVSLTRLLMDVDRRLLRHESFKKRAAYVSITAISANGRS